MFKHNLFTLLNSFSPREIERFNKFLHSPYFNGSKKLQNLYSEIIKYYPGFADIDLTKKNLSSRVSVSGKYNDSTLRDSLSDLLSLARRFLVVESTEKYDIDIYNRLLKELMSRNGNKLFIKTAGEIAQRLEACKEDSELHYNSYRFETIRFNFNMVNDNVLHKAEAGERLGSLKNSTLSLIKFFIMEMTSLQLNFTALKEKYNFTGESLPGTVSDKMNIMGLTEQMQEYTEQYAKEQNEENVLYLYNSLLKMHSRPERDELYIQYKEALLSYLHRLSAGEISFHFYCLINYCIRRKRNKVIKYDYETELLELYTIFLEGKYFKDGKTEYITNDLYRDILLLNLRQERFSWVKDFIEKYNIALHPAERKNMYEYSYMNYFFSTGSYSEALNSYNRLKINNFIYKFDVKNIVLKSYYGLHYYEEALHEIKNYREFLRNNRSMISEKKRQRFEKFLWYTEKLVLFETDFDEDEFEYIEKRLKQEEVIVFKEWLVENYRILKPGGSRNG